MMGQHPGQAESQFISPYVRKMKSIGALNKSDNFSTVKLQKHHSVPVDHAGVGTGQMGHVYQSQVTEIQKQ